MGMGLLGLTEIEETLDHYPRIDMGHFPTPVRAVRPSNNSLIWIKDDGRCSEHYGGNKVRKLEYLFGDMRQRGQAVLVAHGDIQSHTVQACGILGSHAGFEVHAVVFPHHGQNYDSPEISRLRQAGVRLHRQKTMLGAILRAYWIGWRERGFVVPLGASTPIATLGHVRGALELLRQVETGCLPQPERIYLPFATAGSVAGLMIGLGLAGATTRVVAVQTVENMIANQRRLKKLVQNTLNLIGSDGFQLCWDRLESIDNRYLDAGYRAVSAKTIAAVKIAGEHGIRLETAFSGKAFAALLDALPGSPDGGLLFWNTHDQLHQIEGALK